MKFRTYNGCLSEAKKFTSSGAWAKGSLASYNKAMREGWHGQIAKELGFRVKRHWTYGACKAEVSKFNGLAAWAKGHSASYGKAWRQSWQREIACELGWAIKGW